MIDNDSIAAGRRSVLPYGDHALLLECTDTDDMHAVHHWLRDQRRPEVIELVPGARTMLIRVSQPLPTGFVRQLIDLDPPPAVTASSGSVQIDVCYDGDDLAEVARLLGLTEQQVIDRHTAQEWVVAFCGFAPGFGYLAGSRTSFRVPRRSSPRTRVPAGSVALADTWSAVYPTASPGGWQLIGRTDRTLFDPGADPPALLTPGTRVTFRSVSG
jgi:KipI family sensor histidine kinase inhibitor